jgi:putative membrane protein
VAAPEELVTMMLWYGVHWMFWQMLLVWAGMIAFWSILIWAMFALIRNFRGPSGGGRPDGGPRRTLDERLASGEIDEDEYRRLRDLLASDDHRPHAGASAS